MNNKTRTPLFHVARRAALPWYKSWAIRGGAVLLALLVCGLIILFAVMCQASAEVASFPGPPIQPAKSMSAVW